MRRAALCLLALAPALAWYVLHGDGSRPGSAVTPRRAVESAASHVVPYGRLRTRVVVMVAAWVGLLAASRRSPWRTFLAVYPVAILALSTATHIGEPADCGGRLLAPAVPAVAVLLARITRRRSA